MALLVVSAALVAFLASRKAGVTGASLPRVSASAPFDQGLYLQALDHVGRLPVLPASFEQRPMPVDEALRAVHPGAGRPLGALPQSLVLEAAYLIEKDGFKLAQLVYRHDGDVVVVFCQLRSYAVSFAGFPAAPTVIDTQACLDVRCGRFRAYCFSRDEATYTLIGRYDDSELRRVFKAIAGA